MKKCTTENNAELVINEATFAECIALQNIIMQEAKKLDFSLGEIEIESLNSSNISKLLDNFKTLFFSIFTSKDFEKVIFTCLKHCSYNDIQITKNLFDDVPEARNDYYQIIKECIEVNLAPFLKSLTSQLMSIMPQMNTESQELDLQESKID